MIRLIVNIDFDTNDLKEAYKRLHQGVRGFDERVGKKSLGWETSDEWYREKDGDYDEPGSVRELEDAIEAYYAVDRCPECKSSDVQPQTCSVNGQDGVECLVCGECGHTQVPPGES